MKHLKKDMDEASTKAGVKFVGMLCKKAHIKHGAGKELSDILGWDKIIRTDEGVCYKFYAAQPPLIGLTQPIPIHCPLGIRIFDSIKFDIEDIIKMLDGNTFLAVSLSWPLVPECKEPYWYIKLLHGKQMVIGANTGKPINQTP